MSTEFKWFKAENTGKIERYPARFEGRPGLVPVDPSGCVDCGHKETDEDEAVVGFAEPDVDTRELVIDGEQWDNYYEGDTAQEDEDN